MPLNGCLFAVQLASPEHLETIERRLDALSGWYRELGPVEVSLRRAESLRLIIGVISFDGSKRDTERPLVWGNHLPPALDSPAALIEADDRQLRELPTPLAAVTTDGGRGRLVNSPGGVTALFAARSSAAAAWSSHAVAAGWLATGSAEVDPAAVLELAACEYVGGGRTILRGVHEAPQATSVTFAAEGASSECFWPAAERWALIDERNAPHELEQALRDSLRRRLSGADAPVLGLTAGLDSRILAVLLRDRGASAFTYAEQSTHPDMTGARTVAQRLGLPHRQALLRQWPDDEGLRRLHAEARWHEAGAPAWFGDVPWPQPMSHWVTGVGAETGRAFYYRWVGPCAEQKPHDRLVEWTLTEPFASRVLGAEPERVAALRRHWRKSIAQGRAAGLGGWRALDFVYAEQRVRRWGRGLAPRLSAALVPGYGSSDVLRALASLPDTDRIEDRFPRALLQREAPELLDGAYAPAAGGPYAPPARGAAPISPAVRLGLLNRARAARRALRLKPTTRRRPAHGPRWFELAPWSELPSYVGWLTDEVLLAPLLDEAGGSPWRRELRERFLAGESAAGDATVQVAGAVALQRALRELVLPPRAPIRPRR